MSPAKQIVVFDSNILIPLILPASRATRLFSRLQAAGWIIAASPQILDEVAEKLRAKENLRRWLKLTESEIDEYLGVLPVLLRMVPGLVSVSGVVVADSTDDKILASAIEAGASYVISQDRHLLDLRSYQSIMIMDIEQFSAELDRLGVP